MYTFTASNCRATNTILTQVSGGRFSSFSPCIEQVQRTCIKLEEVGFVDIQVMECLQRTYDIKSHTLTVPNVGYSSGEASSVDEAYSGGKLVSPCLTQHSLYAAQPSRKCPGHTGYLTFATLHPSAEMSDAQAI